MSIKPVLVRVAVPPKAPVKPRFTAPPTVPLLVKIPMLSTDVGSPEKEKSPVIVLFSALVPLSVPTVAPVGG